jgi:hypothetical protein
MLWGSMRLRASVTIVTASPPVVRMGFALPLLPYKDQLGSALPAGKYHVTHGLAARCEDGLCPSVTAL